MKKSKQFIVKVQLPIASNEDDAPLLIYNEDRSIMETFAMTDEMHEVFTELKSFHYVQHRKDGKLVFCGEAPWQDW